MYDDVSLTNTKGMKIKTNANTAVFISHAHLDHTRMLNYLDPSIPLYTLKETKMIVNSLNRNGVFLLPSPFEDVHLQER